MSLHVSQPPPRTLFGLQVLHLQGTSKMASKNHSVRPPFYVASARGLGPAICKIFEQYWP